MVHHPLRRKRYGVFDKTLSTSIRPKRLSVGRYLQPIAQKARLTRQLVNEVCW